MRKKSKNFSGMTLVEVLVALTIFTLGMVGVVLLFSKTIKTNAYIMEVGNSTAAITRAVTNITDSLRKIRQADDGSYAIKSIGEKDLVVFLDDDKDGITERVHFFLEDGNLKKGITKPNGSPLIYPAGDQQIQVIAEHIVNTAEEPIFRYYNHDFPIDTENNPMTNPKISEVRLIEIYLWINIKPLTAPDNVNIRSFVEIRNLNENY